MFLLFDPRESSQPGDIPSHGTTGAGHVCFAAQEAELDAWKGRLERHGISIERDYRWPGGGRSLYFRDPDGNCIEIATPRIWGLPEESPEERSNRGWDS
jgi:catechol 2,3-dioxygenase-like lactoylglutathione lyase family enzyme